jgi:Arc/MetJ-type ribon-helix-helix transcriptional regulator
MKPEYICVKIPSSLAKDIDRFRELNPSYRSRAEVVKDALRRLLEDGNPKEAKVDG